MDKTYKTILGLLTASLIFNILGAAAIAIEEDELETKIAKQDGTITQLEKQIKELKKENAELEEKYFYQKQTAEYWYYYNVDDAC